MLVGNAQGGDTGRRGSRPGRGSCARGPRACSPGRVPRRRRLGGGLRQQHPALCPDRCPEQKRSLLATTFAAASRLLARPAEQGRPPMAVRRGRALPFPLFVGSASLPGRALSPNGRRSPRWHVYERCSAQQAVQAACRCAALRGRIGRQTGITDWTDESGCTGKTHRPNKTK